MASARSTPPLASPLLRAREVTSSHRAPRDGRARAPTRASVGSWPTLTAPAGSRIAVARRPTVPRARARLAARAHVPCLTPRVRRSSVRPQNPLLRLAFRRSFRLNGAEASLSGTDGCSSAGPHRRQASFEFTSCHGPRARRCRFVALAAQPALLSREEAWGLAHASERGVPVDDEVVEETADWGPAEPLHVREANARAERRARRAAARDMR